MRVLKKETGINKILFVLLIALLCINFYLIKTSGAWFTDSASSTSSAGTIRFGTVQLNKDVITVSSNTQTLNNVALLPNMKIDIEQVNYIGNVNAYYRITIQSSNEKNSAGQSLTGEQLSTFKSALGNSTTYGYIDISNSTTIAPQSITIPGSLDNTYQGATANLTVTITVLQQPNLGAQNAAAAEKAFSDANL